MIGELTNHCWDCEYIHSCELAEQINFCEDCKDYSDCGICDTYCQAGHSIECNNGFEPKSEIDWEEEDEDNEGIEGSY